MWRAAATSQRRLVTTSVLTTFAAGGYYYYHRQDSLPASYSRFLGYGVAHAEAAPISFEAKRNIKSPPSRLEMLDRLKASSSAKPFDLLIVGGGATGTGVAVDAATRGFKVALVERNDFASGTSSRSTKLIHGGFRYLEKAILNLDIDQYNLVVESLHERATFLHIAPHLSAEVPIMVPVYTWWQIPYYWIGCKCYDLFAGRKSLSHSYFLSATQAIQQFPTLDRRGLKAAIVFYDGMHNDARMNVALATTAIENDAVVANYVEVVQLIKDAEGQIGGAIVRDTLSGETWEVKAKVVINATGPYCDRLLQMDQPHNQTIVTPSSGVHVILPSYYNPGKLGLIDPKTEDNRVIFILPWEGKTIVGTTDNPASVTDNPVPSEEEVSWVLNAVRRRLSPEITLRRKDVLAAWSGIRPLVRDPSAKDSQSIIRSHMIKVSAGGLLTIAGGKWTTYRAMAEETVDAAIKAFGLKPEYPCQTKQVKLTGADGWTEQMYIRLIQDFNLDIDVAQHLAHNYGGRAYAILTAEEADGKGKPVSPAKIHRLLPNHPFLENEVHYAIKHEYAVTAIDMMARRLRLAFLDAQGAEQALPRIVEIMAQELQWSEDRSRSELEAGRRYLESMGLSIVAKAKAEDRAVYVETISHEERDTRGSKTGLMHG